MPGQSRVISAKKLGDKLQKLRLERGYTNIVRFAANLGVSVSTIRKLERGDSLPSFSLVAAISKLTRTHIDYWLE